MTKYIDPLTQQERTITDADYQNPVDPRLAASVLPSASLNEKITELSELTDSVLAYVDSRQIKQPIVERLAKATHELLALLRHGAVPICKTCEGRGWVMAFEYRNLGGGLSLGGSWNEPCPTCQPRHGSATKET